MVQVRILGGAVARVPSDATAYSHRGAGAIVAIIAGAEGPSDLAAPTTWAAQLASAIRPRAVGAYVNFLEDEGEARIRAAYGGSTYARLVSVKRCWDPTNLFRMNQNIRP